MTSHAHQESVRPAEQWPAIVLQTLPTGPIPNLQIPHRGYPLNLSTNIPHMDHNKKGPATGSGGRASLASSQNGSVCELSDFHKPPVKQPIQGPNHGAAFEKLNILQWPVMCHPVVNDIVTAGASVATRERPGQLVRCPRAVIVMTEHHGVRIVVTGPRNLHSALLTPSGIHDFLGRLQIIFASVAESVGNGIRIFVSSRHVASIRSASRLS